MIFKKESEERTKKRKRFQSMLCTGLAIVCLTLCVPLGQTANASAAHTGQVGGSSLISKVAYQSGYDRDQVLTVNNQPFFYNGVQIRIDKLRSDPNYNFSDEQIADAFKLAKKDGFTVVNAQMLWSDIQPDRSVKAEATTFVAGGDDHGKSFSSDDTGDSRTTMQTAYESENGNNQSLAYLKFNLAKLPKGNYDGAKIRIYLRKGLSANHKLTIYGLNEDNWNADTLTWDNAPGHEGYTIGKDNDAKKVSASPSYDPIKQENYYDFDVTSFVNEQKDGMVSFILQSDQSAGHAEEPIVIDGANGDNAPELTVSQKDSYDWSYLDKTIDQARDAGIKLELLWFGSDTTSITTDVRVPFYVFHNYQKSVKADGSPFFSKSSGATTGTYNFLMDKNDPSLQEQESTVMKNMFNHIAKYNKESKRSDTVIGVQVANEPMVSRLHGSPQGVPYSMTAANIELQKKLNLSDQDFRSYILWTYTNRLATAVKESDYSVWTRVNNALPNDADLLGWNEKMRATKGTNLDFVGADPYRLNKDQLYKYGHDTDYTGSTDGSGYARGQNLPVVMESGGETADSANRLLATLAGGAYYNVYDLASGDGHALYDYDKTTKELIPHGDYIQDVIATNQLLNKIAYELATKKSDGAGGKQLAFFNEVPGNDSNVLISKDLDGTQVTYKSDTKDSVGIAVKKSDDEIVLESTRDSDATFKLTGMAQKDIDSVEYGHYKEQSKEWVKDEGKVNYSAADGSVVITMPKYSCVRVKTSAKVLYKATTTAETIVYSAPSAKSKRLGTLKKGTTVTVVGTSGSCLKINYGSGSAWISGKHVKKQTAASFKSYKGVVTTAGAIVYKEPSATSQRVGTLKKGAAVTVVGQKGSCLKINHGKGCAWISARHVTKK